MNMVARHRMRGVIAVFEDIYDPLNAAAVLRTCDAFGIQNIYFIFEQQKSFNPNKIGTDVSTSANKWLSFKTFRSTKICIQELKKEHYVCIGTVPPQEREIKSLFDVKFSEPKIAIFFGNEHAGLSNYAKTHMHSLLSIPMYGMVESFNLSVSAAICLSHISHVRIKNVKNPFVSNMEAKNILKYFLKKK